MTEGATSNLFVVTFILELPRDLPIPNDWKVGPLAERTPAWDGWSGEDLALLTDSPQFPDHLVPGTRATFRRTTVRTGVPLRAADDAFAELVKPQLSVRHRLQRWYGLRKATKKGLLTSRCVVALSCFVPAVEVPEEIEPGRPLDWFRGQFFTALGWFNRYLATLAMVQGDWRSGHVSIGDLPPFMPILFEEVEPGDVVGVDSTHLVASIRPELPDYAGQPDPPADLGVRALGIVNSANRGNDPYLEAFNMLRDAWAHGLNGEPNRCVIALGTGVEGLVATTIREAGHRMEWKERRIEEALSPWIGLKKRVTKHLADLIGQNIDVDDGSNPWGAWWGTAYKMRNRAVHEGQRISMNEAVVAKETSAALVSELRQSLSRQPQLKELASALFLDFNDASHDYDWRPVRVLPATVDPWLDDVN